MSFDSVLFDAAPDFSTAKFSAIANFRQSIFKKRAYFSDARFGGLTVFGGADFRGGADFIYTQFADATLFGSTNTGPLLFGDKVDFRGAVFEGQVTFQNITLSNDTSFVGAVFNSEFKSTNVKFSRAVDFSRAQFRGAAYFGLQNSTRNDLNRQDVSFGNANFDYSRSEKDMHFEWASFGGNLSLVGAQFRALFFSLSGQISGTPQFAGAVDLRGCVYDQFQGNWRVLLQFPDGRPRQDPFDRQPYLQLEQVLRSGGMPDDADTIYLERKNREIGTLRWSSRWYHLIFFKYLLNFGIGPQPWAIAVLVILIGAIFFSRPNSLSRIKATESAPSRPNFWQALRLSLQFFLPLDLPVKSLWEPESRTAVWVGNLLRACGWILVPILILIVAGVIHRSP